jgi:hypothetical protein
VASNSCVSAWPTTAIPPAPTNGGNVKPAGTSYLRSVSVAVSMAFNMPGSVLPRSSALSGSRLLAYSRVTGRPGTVTVGGRPRTSGGVVNTSNRRTVSLAGLGLIGAGAALGLALALPGTAAADPSPGTASGAGDRPGDGAADGNGDGAAGHRS